MPSRTKPAPWADGRHASRRARPPSRPPALLGYGAEVMFWMQVPPAALTDVAESLTRHAALRYLVATAGPTNLLGSAVLKTPTDMLDFSTEVLGRASAGAGAEIQLVLSRSSGIARGGVNSPKFRRRPRVTFSAVVRLHVRRTGPVGEYALGRRELVLVGIRLVFASIFVSRRTVRHHPELVSR